MHALLYIPCENATQWWKNPAAKVAILTLQKAIYTAKWAENTSDLGTTS